MPDEVVNGDEPLDNEPLNATEPELEIQVGEVKPEENAPKVVTMTPEQFAELQAKGDSAQAVLKGIEGLGERLAVPQSAPINTPQQTPEEFFAEHADDLFDKEKGAKVLADYNRMITEREYGPILNSFSAQLVDAKKELLAAKDPMFKKYSSEVEALVKAQPKAVQMQADVLDRAWLTVREKHKSEILEEEVNKKVNELLDAKLKELGIKKNGDERPAAYENSESGSGGMPQARRSTVRLPDEATKRKLEDEANRLGLNFGDYLRVKGYVK